MAGLKRDAVTMLKQEKPFFMTCLLALYWFLLVIIDQTSHRSLLQFFVDSVLLVILLALDWSSYWSHLHAYPGARLTRQKLTDALWCTFVLVSAFATALIALVSQGVTW